MSDTSGTPHKGLPCPVCRIDLVMSDRQGIEIDYCPKCRGVWLDRGELDKIIERSMREPGLGHGPAEAAPQSPAGFLPQPGAPSPWAAAPAAPAAGYSAQPPHSQGYGGHGDQGHGNQGHGGQRYGGHGGYDSHGGGHSGRRGFLGRLFD